MSYLLFWTAMMVDESFKALKLSLRVKTFVGTSANARVQIWAALIAMLLQ
jgi:hypothetical protein